MRSNHLAVAAGSAPPTATSGEPDQTSDTDAGVVADGQDDPRSRERKLSHVLGIQVVIDRTGWVGVEPEIVLRRDNDGQLTPLTVRLSPDTPDSMLVGARSIQARFGEYNQLLQRLRDLGRRAAVQVARLIAPSDSPIFCVHRELAQLGRVVAERQAQTMGNNRMRLSTLEQETDILRRWEEELAPIVVECEVHAHRSSLLGSRGRIARMFDWLRGREPGRT